MSKKKTHRVYVRDKKAQLDGLKTSRGKVEFGLKSAVYVDKETAEEVDARYGMGTMEESVIVAKDEQYDRALNGEKWDIVHDEKRGDWVKVLHKYTFSGVDMKKRGGNEKVKIKTADGYTFISREQAEELGLEIVPKKRASAGGKPEAQHGISGNKSSPKHHAGTRTD